MSRAKVATVSIDGVIPSAARRMPTRVPTGLARAAAALVGAALLLAAVAVPSAARPRQDPNQDTGQAPLAVTIDSITPSTLPRNGNVTLTGTIRNRSESHWTDLQAYLFMSSIPMTTSSELAAATATPETADVGSRLAAPGQYDQLGDLKPGQSTSYTVSVPRKDLPVTGPGVYWIGIHVLGTNELGRLAGADGRARTFIVDMPPHSPKTDLALAIPLRGLVTRTPGGRLLNARAWNANLADDGRLTRVLDLMRTASGVPLTWIVDPAVLDAIRSLAEGNPPFNIGPTDEQGQQGGSPSPSSSASPSASGLPTETPGPVEGGDNQNDGPAAKMAQVAAESQRATTWLKDFTDLVSRETVLDLPYGDVDVATVLRGDFRDVYDRANVLSAQAMADFGIDGRPVVAPANGLLPNAAVPKLDPGTTVLLSQRAARTDATTIRVAGGLAALLGSDAARVGGPSPTPRYDALALRQRILAEAAVRALDHPAGRPLVVTMPDSWNPGSSWASAAFFPGLDVPWVRMVDVPLARMLSHARRYPRPLAYPRAVRRHELPVGNILASQELNQAGGVLQNLLARNDTVGGQIGRAAMLGSSSDAKSNPQRALTMVRRISEQVHHQLREVTVQGSTLVTMSSGTGIMTVRVVNGLDEPVTVGLDARTGTDALKIRPPDLVTLGPGQRASVRLAVTATGTGVHSAQLTPTTKDGQPLGSSTRIKVRSSQVGLVIWLILGTGAVVFVAAIAARILRRVRERDDDGEQADDREQEDIAS